MGAVIAKGNKFISGGWNVSKTHPKSNSYRKHIHAEFSAILRSKESLEGCDIYVYREKKDWSMGLAEPCKFCVEMLKSKGIKTVYFTTNEGYRSKDL